MPERKVRVLVSGGILAIAGLISGCDAVKPIPRATVTPGSAILLPGQSVAFSAAVNGVPVDDPIWMVNGVVGGASATGTVSSSGFYTAPTGAAPIPPQVTVSVYAHDGVSMPVPVSLFQPSHFQRGTVSASNNPLVALYHLNAPEGATVQVQFGTTTDYGLTTSLLPVPDAGGDADVEVAGMRANTTYHMQATAHLADGTAVVDSDQTFTTGAVPADVLPNLTVKQTPGLNPGSGVEMLCLFEETSQSQLTAVVTDLAGNVIWYYAMQPNAPFPMKLLPNGHMLVIGDPLNAIQEVDLAGNVISQVSLTDIQRGLSAAGISFPPLTSMDHDLVELPNGHVIVIISYKQSFADQPGIGTVTGNALVDWNPQKGPAWTWSTFDHIPLSHAPFGTSDWTHANALLYSPDDGNLILSMRNQDWVVKINYQNGAGDGSIVWRLGPDGDFTLPSGQAPIEWNYGQHYPVFLGPATSGIFPLMIFNNGNNRMVDANNDFCGTAGLTPCYSSVPIFELNEFTKTAEVLGEVNLSPAYSTCCGSTNELANGDWEYDVAADVNTPGASYIQEVTPGQQPQLVWQMNVTGQLAYRGFRIPSLYPGVVWTQSAIAAANIKATPQPKSKVVNQHIPPPIL